MPSSEVIFFLQGIFEVWSTCLWCSAILQLRVASILSVVMLITALQIISRATHITISHCEIRVWKVLYRWTFSTREHNFSTMLNVSSLFSTINWIHKFDICVTVDHWYSNINSQLDATITILLIISISSTCFRW